MSGNPVRVVIDTNVFVAALLSDATPRRVYEAFLAGTIALLFSRQTLFELATVLSRPSIRLVTSRAEADSLLFAIQHDGVIVEVRERVLVCRDPKDNRFLECALDLLTIRSFHGTRILRPAEFLRLLPS